VLLLSNCLCSLWLLPGWLMILKFLYYVLSFDAILNLYCYFFILQGKHGALSDLADLLVQNNLYDMAFTILLRFFKGSGLKRFTPLRHLCACVSLFVYMYWYAYICDLVYLFRELERVLSEMAIKCCHDKVESTWVEYVNIFLTLYLWSSFIVETRYLTCCLSVIHVV
jgi:nuclear pore complex protein Nup160